MVVMNCANTTQTNYPITGFPANGAWFVNLNSDWKTYSSDFGNIGTSLVQVSGGNGSVTLAPYSALILSRSALPGLDSDGDGLLNGWEQTYFGDPLIAIATADDDQDGANNLQEQAADTDPHSPASVLKFLSAQVASPNVSLTWQGGQAVRQIIQQATNPAGPWFGIFTNPPPTPITNLLTIPFSTNSPSLYRIQVTP
jgi:hypothetical protein